MGRERALLAIRYKETDRIPQIEYIAHTLLVKKLSGLDPGVEPEKALSKTYDALDIDLIWYTDEPSGFLAESCARRASASGWRQRSYSICLRHKG